MTTETTLTTTPLSTPADWAVDNFVAFEQSLNGEKEKPFFAQRKSAISYLKDSGFPTKKTENWRYTDISEIAKKKWSPLPLTQVSPATLPVLPALEEIANRIVLVNGAWQEALSSVSEQQGVRVTSYKKALNDPALSPVVSVHLDSLSGVSEDPFCALNTAYHQDGVCIVLEKGSSVLDLLLVQLHGGASEGVSTPRVLIVAAEGTSARLLEIHQSLNSNEEILCAPVAEIVLAEGASVDHYQIQQENASAKHFSWTAASVASQAVYRNWNFSFGGSLARNNIAVKFTGENANAFLYGLTAIATKQHVDNQTFIDHAVPHCESSELYKGIYGDSSEGVFVGTIIVREDAQKTNAMQSNRALLLSDTATINAKPQLKIWADDVKCTHGAAIGQLDEEGIFYMMARGIDRAEAKKIATTAYAHEVVSSITWAPVKRLFAEALDAKLVQMQG